MARKIKIPEQLQVRAAFEAATFDEATSSVEVVFTAGTRGLRRSWDGDYYEELEVSDKAVDLSRLNNGASVLNAHSAWDLRDVIGVVERAWIQDGEGRATVRFSERDDVKPVVADVKAGILRHISVGYRVQKYEQVEKTEGGIPVLRATNWTPMEISLVPIAFDDRAVVRGKGSDAQSFHEVEIETRGMPPHEGDVMTDEEKRAAAAKAAAEKQAETARAAQAENEVKPGAEARVSAEFRKPEVSAEAERAAGALMERERIDGINKAVRIAKLGDDFARKLISDGTSLDQVRTLVFDELAKRDMETDTSNVHPVTSRGEDALDKQKRGMGAWLMLRSGSSVVLEAKRAGLAGFKDLDLDPGEFRGASLADLARIFLETRGERVHGFNAEKMVRRALEFRGGMQTTSDFAVLLEDALHKSMDAGYQMAPSTWQRFCRTGDAKDFRAHLRYRTAALGLLEQVNEHGEFKNLAISDGEKASFKVYPYGAIVALTREVIVNDDMGAFVGLAAAFGESASRTIEAEVYRQLLLNGGMGPTMEDGHPFFYSARGNVASAGTALSVTGIDGDLSALARQKDPSGQRFLSLQPGVLLVPTELGGTADLINNNETDPSATSKFQVRNIVRNKFKDVVPTPELTGTRRYIFADRVTAIEVDFLNGQSTPTIEMQDGWRTSGVEWKCSHDFGVNFIDPRAAYVNDGAA